MIQKVWKLFTDDKLEIKERLFRIILVVGNIAVGLAIGTYFGKCILAYAALCAYVFGIYLSTCSYI